MQSSGGRGGGRGFSALEPNKGKVNFDVTQLDSLLAHASATGSVHSLPKGGDGVSARDRAGPARATMTVSEAILQRRVLSKRDYDAALFEALRHSDDAVGTLTRFRAAFVVNPSASSSADADTAAPVFPDALKASLRAPFRTMRKSASTSPIPAQELPASTPPQVALQRVTVGNALLRHQNDYDRKRQRESLAIAIARGSSTTAAAAASEAAHVDGRDEDLPISALFVASVTGDDRGGDRPLRAPIVNDEAIEVLERVRDHDEVLRLADATTGAPPTLTAPWTSMTELDGRFGPTFPYLPRLDS